MKRTIRLFLILILALICASCTQYSEDDFFDMNQQASGGVIAPEAGMNIRDIDISYFQNQTEIALHIVYGSREETQSEAIVADLPKYEVFLLEEPYRLGVRLYGVEYVDYIEKASWALEEHVVGVFRERIANKEYTTVYFQLKERVRFRVDEGDSNIRIILESDETEPQNNHFVMLNAFDEYLEGVLPESLGLTPVLTADRENIAMISKPYRTSTEAEARLAELEAIISTSPISKTPYTMTLAGEALPVMNMDIDRLVPAEKKMVVVDGAARILPVLIENGTFAAQREQVILYTRPYTPDANESEMAGEELWALTDDDRITQMNLPPFTSVQNVSFSTGGRFIGFIDVTVNSRVLYVYDQETDRLYNLGEEGIGNTTMTYAWAKEDDALYAITGTEQLRLIRCEFIEGALDVRIIADDVSGEGKIEDFGNAVIFADNLAGEHGIIYRIDKTTGEKTFLTEGMDFKISPDGAMMAVLTYNDFGEEQAYVNLKTYSFSDQSEKVIEEGAIIESFVFLPSSNILLYSDGTKSDYTYRFLYALQSCNLNTGEMTTLAHMATGTFYLSEDSSECYLIDYYLGDDGRYNYTTYVYTLS